MIELTERATQALAASIAAARRFDPGVTVRLVRTPAGLESRLAETAEAGDQEIAVGDHVVYAEVGIEGTIDAGDHNVLRIV